MTATTDTHHPSAIQLNSAIRTKQRTLWGDAWRQFRKNRLSMFGLTVLTLIVTTVLLLPLVYTADVEYIDFSIANQRPSLAHPFGTDDLGRDVLARNLYGGRISLAVGLAAMAIAITVGSGVGLLSGFFPRLDNPLMRFTDMMLALPQLPLLLVIIMLFRDSLSRKLGPEMGIFVLVVTIIGVLGWMPTSRIVRGSVLSIKQKEFVEAATNIGARRPSILMRHILPNVLSPITVSATLGVATAILNESVLSFLGLGFPSDVPTWGRLLYDGKDFISTTPWVVIFPGLFISLTILSINFMGDGLRDALDPRQRS